jgi:hypothetical protein
MGPWGTLSYQYVHIQDEDERLIPVLYDCLMDYTGYFYYEENG